MDGVISLGVGEPDFVTPWTIREAAINSISQGETMYTSNYGTMELRTAVAHHLERRYGVSYDPATEILITVGVSEAMDLALRSLVDPGDECLIPDPCYVSYGPCATLAGGDGGAGPHHHQPPIQAAPTRPGATYHLQEQVLVIGFPSNPTARSWSAPISSRSPTWPSAIALVVVSDEIYARLTYDTDHACFAALPGMREQTVLLGGFSKSYAMTGWRVGYAAAPANCIEAMMKVHQYVTMCAPTMSQAAAVEALRRGEQEVQDMTASYDRRRRYIVSAFNDMGLDCFEPKGAFYAFPSIRSTGMTSDDFVERLLIEEKVAAVPGSAFGACGEGHIRCCYATSMEGDT